MAVFVAVPGHFDISWAASGIEETLHKGNNNMAAGQGWGILTSTAVTGTWALLSGRSPVFFFFTKLPELRRTEVYVGEPHTDLHWSGLLSSFLNVLE